MPVTITNTAVVRYFPTFNISPDLTPEGHSEEAIRIKQGIEEDENTRNLIFSVIEEYNIPQRSSILGEIYAVAEECSSENWDGYGALPISRKAVEIAKTFIKFLPFGYPNPELSPEPDGDIALEWHVKDDKWIIISFNSKGEFHFASQIDSNTKFDGRGVLNSSENELLMAALKKVVEFARL